MSQGEKRSMIVEKIQHEIAEEEHGQGELGPCGRQIDGATERDGATGAKLCSQWKSALPANPEKMR